MTHNCFVLLVRSVDQLCRFPGEHSPQRVILGQFSAAQKGPVSDFAYLWLTYQPSLCIENQGQQLVCIFGALSRPAVSFFWSAQPEKSDSCAFFVLQF